MTETSDNMNTETNDTVGEHLGQVQWFNKKKGFGFIKNVNDTSTEDVFFHFSNICTDGYKILYPGEFVSMSIEPGNDGKNVCKNIRGVGGLPLLTDNENYHYRVMPKRNVHQ
jgi:cold shock protein